MAEGTIVLGGKDKKTLQIKFITSKGKEMLASPKESELSRSLLQKKQTAIAQLDGLQVEFDLFNGQPIQVREPGQVWEAPRSTGVQKERKDAGDRRTERSPQKDSPVPSAASVRSQPSARLPGDFHNPYNFVPALPRLTDHAELGDAEPGGHGCYQENRWSGRISVTLTTVTPLLIPDAANLEENTDPNSKEYGHKTYPIRIGMDGKPYLPPTSIKGMLRSAYEAVTNSRLAIFEKHGNRLAYRMPAEGNKAIYPARVEQRDNRLYLRILVEPDLLDKVGKLPRYRTKAQDREIDKGASQLALPYEGSADLPQHGDSVWVRLNLQQNDEANLPPTILSNLKDDLKPRNGSVKLSKSVVTRIQKREPGSKPPGTGDWRKGWVCVTGANISGKRYERVFIEHDDDPLIPINEELKSLWKDLILDYQKQHQRDLIKRQDAKPRPQQPQDYLGDDPGKTGWSTHVYQSGMDVLDVGTLCYVELKTDLEDSNLIPDQVKAIAPVVLSRRLYAYSPEELLDQSLKPAKSRSELSPADRVFGWVNQNGKGAYKGNLRIGSVQCITEQPLEVFGEMGVPLAILGQPKPQQARFYVAKDRQGTPLDNGTPKATGYQKLQGLRGRKVYVHHRGLSDIHWDEPMSDRTQHSQNGFYQEYRRPKMEIPPDPKKPRSKNAQPQYRERDDQNRSIQGWVKPDVTFQLAIDITNLSQVELGALLWLLDLPDQHYHRLGAGKPLGFGSVQLAIDWTQTDLRTGQDWQKFYLSFTDTLVNAEPAAKAAIAAYHKAFEQAYGSGQAFGDIPLIQAFCRHTQGFEDGKPVHYPRARQQSGTDGVPPHPEGKAFEWFVANERSGRDGGPKVALPELWNEQGLPLLDKPRD